MNRLALDDIDQRLRGAARSPPGVVGRTDLARAQGEEARQYLSRGEDYDDEGYEGRRQTVNYYEDEVSH